MNGSMKNTVACLVDGVMRDLSGVLPDGARELTPILADSPEGLAIIRHSTAHIMAEAVKKLFPAAQVTIGPAIENGFYYDFAFERPFTPEDLEAIEAEMQKSIAANHPFSCTYVPKADAKALFASQGEVYKLEIMSVYLGAQLSDVFEQIKKGKVEGCKHKGIMEIPPYRLPTLRGVVLHTWERVWQYVKKAGTVILAASILMADSLNTPGFKRRLACLLYEILLMLAMLGLDKPNRQKKGLNRDHKLDVVYFKRPASEVVKQFGVSVF